MLSGKQSSEARILFDRALAVRRADREAFLIERLSEGTDPVVVAGVRELLAFVGEESEPTAPDAVGHPDQRRVIERFIETSSPSAVGPYRIVSVLGQGGMGTVHEAIQARPHRTVALKVVRPGLASPQMLARFEHEAEVLGRLQHAGIAQIYEAGTADLGDGPQPFFAMEFVDGVPLTRYAGDRGLDIVEKLRLVALVADAVQHAHQKGVIHRDIKPGNILVDRKGQPKVLDFGVARSTDGDVRASTIETHVGQLVGTVRYMSPEQAGGHPADIDTRSDVYSLGVILYELLTGRLPHDISDRAPLEAARIIRDEQPSRLSSTNRAFRGDVETIVAHALERDKTRRYQSAGDFAADIRRFLADEPIAARPATTWYQAAKFSKRHAGLVASIATVLVGLVGGSLAVMWGRVQAFRARAIRLEARASEAELIHYVASDLIGIASPQGELGPKSTMGEVLKFAAARLRTRHFANPRIESTMYRQLADFQTQFGDLKLAVEFSEHAVSVLSGESANSIDLGRALAVQAETLSEIDHARSLAAALRALPILDRAIREDPPDPGDCFTWAATVIIETRCRMHLGQMPENELCVPIGAAVDRCAAAGVEETKLASLRTVLVDALGRAGRIDESESEAASIVDTFVRLDPGHPMQAYAMQILASHAAARGEMDGVEWLCERSIDAVRNRAGPNATSLAETLDGYGELMRTHGQIERAIHPLSEALAIHLAHAEDLGGPRAPQYVRDLVGSLSYRLADSLRFLGRLDEAESSVRAAEDYWLADYPEDGLARVKVREMLATVLAAEGRNAEANCILANIPRGSP